MTTSVLKGNGSMAVGGDQCFDQLPKGQLKVWKLLALVWFSAIFPFLLTFQPCVIYNVACLSYITKCMHYVGFGAVSWKSMHCIV